MHHNMYGGHIHDRSQGYEHPQQLFKRQRSGSDHNPYGYNSMHFQGGPVSQYNPNLQSSGSVWSAHPQSSFQHEQSPSWSGIAIHNHVQSGTVPGFQRAIQEGPFSAPAIGAGGYQYFGNTNITASIPRNQPVGNYSQQAHSPYDSRTSRDAYQSIPSVQAGASADTGLASLQHQAFLSSAPELSGHISETSHAQSMPQQQEMQSSATQFGMPVHSAARYQTTAHPDSSSAPYDQATQADAGKYTQSPFDGVQNLYRDPPREAYSTIPSTLSDPNLSLSAGMLNRSFIPPQTASQYDYLPEQDFKEHPDSYPTPNQTSPLG